MYHVKETTKPVAGNLDLNIADEDEFSPDKLRATLERLYMTVGIGLLGFGKHIVRIRSWREKRRTACFCAVRIWRKCLPHWCPDVFAFRHTLSPGQSTL